MFGVYHVKNNGDKRLAFICNDEKSAKKVIEEIGHRDANYKFIAVDLSDSIIDVTSERAIPHPAKYPDELAKYIFMWRKLKSWGY